ncbi:MAG: uL22 family ribosomal protein [Deltaproteobacteria bacterium]|jgi:large subunit ribosomal protein L22|nr:uL22 family ribosomal protein [Deltaproteobacteria bacterium]
MKKAKTLPRNQRPKRDLCALSKYLRCPPSKAAVRARTLAGLSAARASAMLACSPASSARLILKVLKSAIANAVAADPNRNPDGLTVESVQIGKAPYLKRHHPVSHGAAKPILKRFCHISVRLRYDEPPAIGFDDGPGAVRRRRTDPTGKIAGALGSSKSSRAARVAASKAAKAAGTEAD